jgi:hypothetical protein
MRTPKFTCLYAAAFFTITPQSAEHFLHSAKNQLALNDKIHMLRKVVDQAPLAQTTAREHLVSLLTASNRYDEALAAYRVTHPSVDFGASVDFKLLDLLLKTGHYEEILRATARPFGQPSRLSHDFQILEIRVQALLAQGQYRTARQCVDQWLDRYTKEGLDGTRFATNVDNIRFLRRHLRTLERFEGPIGKALYTASVPDSLQHWSQRRDLPVYFFKLVPAHSAGQPPTATLPGRHAGDDFFRRQVDELNRGFEYLSGGSFSLQFRGLNTLYVKQGDMDPAISGGHVLTSRVYVHTLPQLYRLAGEAYVVLVDYRAEAEDEAAYMGDGLIHLSANKFQTLILMHEVLHGLGATHQDWSSLEKKGYQFDAQDRGLMTFERGQISTLGLEEKNRAVLGWPQVSSVRLRASEVAFAAPEAPSSEITTLAQAVSPL